MHIGMQSMKQKKEVEKMSFSEHRKTLNLKPVELKNKEKFYLDIMNIENSWTGRMDTSAGNTFIMESVQLIVNSMELFELGYFDCAYYSLRSAVEISTTMVFLSDMPHGERENFLESWKSTKDFPMQGKMLSMLSEKGGVFIDVKEEMPDFFEFAKKLNKELHKYVHKQGFKHFYVSRNHPINGNKSMDGYVATFQSYLKKCITVVAVMRLVIDPFPILLMDQDILYRCFDSMTDPYSQEFVDEYIGELFVNEYKNTSIYTSTYDSFINEPLKSEATFDVMKYQCIDTTKKDEILLQISLLKQCDVICCLLAFSSQKIVKIYGYGGWMMYFTERKTNRKSMSWSGMDFKNFETCNEKINLPYDESYISVFKFNNETYFIEHNEMLNEEEYKDIDLNVRDSLDKYDIEE